MPPKSMPPPMSPTELLWAHQLKREHGLLLHRLQTLEAAVARAEMSTLAAKNAQDIAAVAEQVKLLRESASSNTAAEQVRKEVNETICDVRGGMKAITSKINDLDKEIFEGKDERRRSYEKDVATAKKLKALEGEMKEHRKQTEGLGRGLDDATVEDIWGQLKAIKEDTKKGEEDVKRVEATVQVLEEMNRELKRQNGMLAEEVKALEERPTTSPRIAPTIAYAAPIAAAETIAETGDAVVACDSVPPNGKTRIKQLPPKAAPRVGPATSEKKSKAAPRTGPALSNQKIKATPLGQSHKKAEVSPDGAVELAPIDNVTQHPIVRMGKGWIEILDEQSIQDDNLVGDEEETISQIGTKRDRGHGVECARPNLTAPVTPSLQPSAKIPRKAAIHRSLENEERPPTKKRRIIKQEDHVQALEFFQDGCGDRRKKRIIDAVIDESIDIHAPRLTRAQRAAANTQVPAAAVPKIKLKMTKKKKSEEEMAVPRDARRGLTNIFSSPLSSPQPPLAVRATHKTEGTVSIKRRRIKQVDDSPEL